MTKLDHIIKENTYKEIEDINDDVDAYQHYVFEYVDNGKGHYTPHDRDLMDLKSILVKAKSDFLKITTNHKQQTKITKYLNKIINDCNGKLDKHHTTKDAEGILNFIINDSSDLEAYINDIYKNKQKE